MSFFYILFPVFIIVIIGLIYFSKIVSDAAKRFLLEISAGQIKKAYKETAPEFKEKNSFEDLKVFIEENPVLKEIKKIFVVSSSTFWGPRLGVVIANGKISWYPFSGAKLDIKITGRGGAVMRVTMWLKRADGRWAVSDINRGYALTVELGEYI